MLTFTRWQSISGILQCWHIVWAVISSGAYCPPCSDSIAEQDPRGERIEADCGIGANAINVLTVSAAFGATIERHS